MCTGNSTAARAKYMCMCGSCCSYHRAKGATVANLVCRSHTQRRFSQCLATKTRCSFNLNSILHAGVTVLGIAVSCYCVAVFNAKSFLHHVGDVMYAGTKLSPLSLAKPPGGTRLL